MTDHDHRALGRALDLFDSDPLVGAGLPYWLPAGAAVRHALEEYVREVERRAGYRHVHSPVLGKRELYELSGHWAHYRDAMFPPVRLGSEEVVLRPSLCPHHCLIFRSRGRSHRDLPLRVAELGGMFREEASGVLGGLARVRAMQLNDAHVFCAPGAAGEEVGAALDLMARVHRDLGVVVHRFRLSLPGDGGKYVDDPQLWSDAGRVLDGVLRDRGLPFDAEPGEAAFYGPKIDVQVLDAAGRESTLATVQLDAFMPRRFGLEFVTPSGGRERPLVVHRSLLGSLERVVAHLVERTGGAFPAWLAPVQLAVLPVGDAQQDAARRVTRVAVDAGLRAELVAAHRGSLASRVRAGRLVPYLAVVGAREAARGAVSLRSREDGGRCRELPVAAAVAEVREVSARPAG